jgi:dinuclear metal center YbgI/SA1388 family protein
MLLRELDRYFRSLLRIDDMVKIDASLNGIQAGRPEQKIGRIAFAVDACMDCFRLATAWGAELLFVHHGLFWGKDLRVTGSHRARLKHLLDNDLALYAAHLPLDMHPEIGNNAGIACALGLVETVPFGTYKGVDIGIKGRFPRPVRLAEVETLLFGGAPDGSPGLAFGKEFVETAGIVSGGAPYEAFQAAEQGLDLYITGEGSHAVYHFAQEEGLNVIFGGHYRTETWGVRLLAERTARETGLETRFIDVPTGL